MCVRSCFVRVLVCAVLVLVACGVASGETITTVIDASGDGLGHTLSLPSVAADGDNVYVVGVASNNAFRVAPDGEISLLIDSTGDGLGNGLNQPLGMVAFDSVGNLFVAGLLSDNVFRIAPDGSIREIIGMWGDGYATLSIPTLIGVDSADNVYVAGTGSNNVFKIAPVGTITKVLDSNGAGTPGSFSKPRGLAFDSSNSVYVSSYDTDRVFKVTSQGTVSEVSLPASLNGPGSLAVDEDDNLYVASALSDEVFKRTPGGVVTTVIDFSGDGAGSTMKYPTFLQLDDDGNLYVGGRGTSNVFRVTPASAITELIGPAGACRRQPMAGLFNMTVLGDGTVYAVNNQADNSTEGVFKVTPEGGVRRIIGSSGDGMAGLLHPGAVAVDSAGNVYVDGGGSDNVFKIDPGGCNDNGVPDADDIANGTSVDCNTNGIPDECEIDEASSAPGGPFLCTECCDTDCNNNGVPDLCDFPEDCNGNSIADFCEIMSGTSTDCNDNGVPDWCDSPDDCNGNSVPDVCDIVAGTSTDCNGNSVPDECENDCNCNGVDDGQDVLTGTSPDENGDGVPDECCAVYPATFVGPVKSRYLTIGTFGYPSSSYAMRVTVVDNSVFPELNGTSFWVAAPKDYPEEDATDPGRTFVGARLSCLPQYWPLNLSESIHVFGPEIVPESTYEITMVLGSCVGAFASASSETAPAQTGAWGDSVEPLQSPEHTVQPDFRDISAAADKFVGLPGAPIKARVQMAPNLVDPQSAIDFNDISATVGAFLGGAYADTVTPETCSCPSDVTCGPGDCTDDSDCASGHCHDGLCLDACGRCTPSVP